MFNYFDSLGAIIVAQWLSDVQFTKCEFTLSVCILEGTDTRAFGIRGYFLQLLKYQDFCSINSILKELNFISEAPLDVLKVELWVVTGDLAFPREQWFCLC